MDEATTRRIGVFVLSIFCVNKSTEKNDGLVCCSPINPIYRYFTFIRYYRHTLYSEKMRNIEVGEERNAYFFVFYHTNA